MNNSNIFHQIYSIPIDKCANAVWFDLCRKTNDEIDSITAIELRNKINEGFPINYTSLLRHHLSETFLK